MLAELGRQAGAMDYAAVGQGGKPLRQSGSSKAENFHASSQESMRNCQMLRRDPNGRLEFLEKGKLRGDRVLIEREALDKLNDKFFQGIKVGSLVHKSLAVPVRLLDAALGTDLANCGDCAVREIKLNALTTKTQG